MENNAKIGLFIDANNASSACIESILSELANYGVVNVRRAYGDWTKSKLSSWKEALHDNAFQPIHQFDRTEGKNRNDMALVIDVMDSLYTKNVDVICLVSADCDFMPLANRAMESGKLVIGFGERKTPQDFVNRCHKFFYIGSKETGNLLVESDNTENNGYVINSTEIHKNINLYIPLTTDIKDYDLCVKYWEKGNICSYFKYRIKDLAKWYGCSKSIGKIRKIVSSNSTAVSKKYFCYNCNEPYIFLSREELISCPASPCRSHNWSCSICSEKYNESVQYIDNELYEYLGLFHNDDEDAWDDYFELKKTVMGFDIYDISTAKDLLSEIIKKHKNGVVDK